MSWVAFWALYGEGFTSQTVTNIVTLGAAYMPDASQAVTLVIGLSQQTSECALSEQQGQSFSYSSVDPHSLHSYRSPVFRTILRPPVRETAPRPRRPHRRPQRLYTLDHAHSARSAPNAEVSPFRERTLYEVQIHVVVGLDPDS